MREIKFKAWSLRKRVMGKAMNYMTSSAAQALRNTLNDEPKDSFILLQYTGLKDKNGKEIYEGDIVKVVHDYSKKGYRVVDVHYEIPNRKNDFNIDLFPFSEFNHLEGGYGTSKQSEIIGNIYENPDLLK